MTRVPRRNFVAQKAPAAKWSPADLAHHRMLFGAEVANLSARAVERLIARGVLVIREGRVEVK